MLAVLAFLLAGCGAGQVTQTATQATATGGASGRVGSILVRDAQFVFPGSIAGGAAYRPGEDAPLQVTIVNDATATQPDRRAPDRLVAVASPVAGSGRIDGDARIGDGQVLTAGYADPPPGTKTVGITLVGLSQPVRAGVTYPVVFTFERAGELRIGLPVETPLNPTPDRENG